jgi:hypothetical protein
MDNKAITVISMIQNEYYRTRDQLKRPLFNSRHEGMAVLWEEMDELWQEIIHNGSNERVLQEAIQVGAMALKFIISCCEIKDLKANQLL